MLWWVTAGLPFLLVFAVGNFFGLMITGVSTRVFEAKYEKAVDAPSLASIRSYFDRHWGETLGIVAAKHQISAAKAGVIAWAYLSEHDVVLRKMSTHGVNKVRGDESALTKALPASPDDVAKTIATLAVKHNLSETTVASFIADLLFYGK